MAHRCHRLGFAGWPGLEVVEGLLEGSFAGLGGENVIRVLR